MTDVFSNPWVTGVGGGIVSSFIVFFITQQFFTNRNAAEYRQKVDATNKEVLYALRPGIPEESIPERQVVKALLRSTARKYQVDDKDIYDVRQVGEELVKEVMDSSFISARQKLIFCKQLTAMVSTYEEMEQIRAGNLLAPTGGLAVTDLTATAQDGAKEHARSRFIAERSRFGQYFAAALSLMSGLMTVLVAFFSEEHLSVNPHPDFIILFPTILAIITLLIIFFLSFPSPRIRDISHALPPPRKLLAEDSLQSEELNISRVDKPE